MVSDYLDGTLAEHDRRLIERHLAACPPCVYYLEQMRGVIHVSATLRETIPDAETRKHLLAAFREWKSTLPVRTDGPGI